MIHRPLVFGIDAPSVMVYREQIGKTRQFLSAKSIPHEATPFQQSFELIKFPGLNHDAVEDLMDQLARLAD